VGAIATPASLVIRPRLPEGATLRRSTDDRGAAALLTDEMLGEEPGMEVRAGVAA